MNSIPNVPETELFQGGRSRTADKQTARCALAAEVLRVPGTVSLRVGGCCMLPSLRPGDVIAVRRVQACDIRPGRLVVYALKDEDFTVRRAVRWDTHGARMITGVSVGMFTVHRAVSCNRNVLITRADAALENDAPVQTSRILGEVVAIQRGRRRLIPTERLNRAQKLFRFFLRRSALLRRLILRLYSLRQAMNHSQPSPGWGS